MIQQGYRFSGGPIASAGSSPIPEIHDRSVRSVLIVSNSQIARFGGCSHAVYRSFRGAPLSLSLSSDGFRATVWTPMSTELVKITRAHKPTGAGTIGIATGRVGCSTPQALIENAAALPVSN